MEKSFSATKAVCFLMLCFLLLFLEKGDVYATEIASNSAYHTHKGSSGGGGCFAVARYCGGAMQEQTLNPHGCGINAAGGGCPHCGCWYEAPSSKYPSGCAHCNCPKPKVNRCTRCGSEGGGGSCSNVTHYDPNCGKDGNSLVARLKLLNSTQEWCKELMLEAIPEILDESEIPLPLNLQWNEEEMSQNREYVVSENGKYRCAWNISKNGINKILAVEAIINNIDNTPPQIAQIEEETEFVREKLLTIRAEDLQEDNTNGSGLAELPYSIDGGETWQTESDFLITKNKGYLLAVKDILENTAFKEVLINNIDRVAPQLQVILQEKQIYITAKDLQEDGGEGCGLAEKAYSFDGGTTWSQENVFITTQVGEYKIAVTDKLGNIAYETLSIEEEKKEEPARKEPEVLATEIMEVEEIQETQAVTIEVIPKKKATIVESISKNQVPLEIKKVEMKKNMEIPQIKITKLPKETKAQKSPIVKTIIASSIIILSILGIFALLYLWYIAIFIYECLPNNKKQFLGITFLWKEEEYTCKIAEEIKEIASTNSLALHLNPLFSKRYYLEKLIIQLEENRKVVDITREILLRMY